ncbi:MAG: phosphatidylglycerophosphatase A [Acidobacteria bacterium]|nr:phosphatidylglycerophosphatase A [Acidobacteriota bacterium]
MASINLQTTNSLTEKIPKTPSNLWFWVATGLGLGLSPFAPGTVGALLGLVLAYPVQHLSGQWFWIAYFGGLIVLVWVGVVSSSWLCRFLSVKDPPAAVIDEIAAQFLVTALVPPALESILISFLLSRLFDILKLFPCRRAEQLPEGWGVVTDDLIAGVYAVVVYHLVFV